jgi:hypothetical protein
MNRQRKVEGLDTLDRIQALTYALSRLPKVEEHCTLHPLVVQLLTAMVSQECDTVREFVRPNNRADAGEITAQTGR